MQNKVDAWSNTTPLVQPSGAGFPHFAVLDFAQDTTLGKESVGWSCPTAMPIQHGWYMNQCPILLNFDACVPMPILISVKALETTCPGLMIDPISPQDKLNQLTAANGSPNELFGSVNLHFCFKPLSLDQL